MSNKNLEPVEGVIIQTVTDKGNYLIQTHEEMINYVMAKINYNAGWVANFEVANQEILNGVFTKGWSFGMPGYTFQRVAR